MEITLDPWGSGDLELVRRLNTPEMTAYLGGPESQEKIVARNLKYIEFATHADKGVFRILVDGAPAGVVNFWPSEWNGEAVYEMGWAVVSEFQGRGVAASAVQLALAQARAQGAYRLVHAFPNVENAASNAVCRRGGFALAGSADVEYPPGETMHANDWVYDLDAADGSGERNS